MPKIDATKNISARALVLLVSCCAILLGAIPAHAALWGWSATVTAVDRNDEDDPNDDTHHHETVSGATYPDCDVARENTVITWEVNGYDILNEGSCGPIFVNFSFDFRDLITPRVELPRWPWPGPVCLSCPILFDENIKVLFPNNPGRVQSLIKKYDIDSYNRELLNLQQQFDLEDFERELYLIENESLFKN